MDLDQQGVYEAGAVGIPWKSQIQLSKVAIVAVGADLSYL